MDNNATQVDPHGGRLINLLVDAERAALLKDISMNLPDLTLNDRQLCDLELLDQALAGVDASVVVHRIEGGDHSFRVPKRLGRDETEVWAEMATAAADWIQRQRP